MIFDCSTACRMIQKVPKVYCRNLRQGMAEWGMFIKQNALWGPKEKGKWETIVLIGCWKSRHIYNPSRIWWASKDKVAKLSLVRQIIPTQVRMNLFTNDFGSKFFISVLYVRLYLFLKMTLKNSYFHGGNFDGRKQKTVWKQSITGFSLHREKQNWNRAFQVNRARRGNLTWTLDIMLILHS